MKFTIELSWNETTQRITVAKRRCDADDDDDDDDDDGEVGDSTTLSEFFDEVGIENFDCRQAFTSWARQIWETPRA